MLKRFFGGRAKGLDLRAVIPGAKEGGHGDHWGCVMRSVQERDLIPYLADITRKDDHPYTYTFGPGSTHKGLAFYSPPGAVRTCVLVTNNMLASAYPVVEDGPLWPVTVHEVLPWANGLEGQIKGDCLGASIGFFDTRFYANQRRYEVGQTYRFHMGAFAYILERAPDGEFETDMGAKVSWKGANAFMPASFNNEQADVDDIWFHSPLEAERGAAHLVGPPLYSYPIILAIPQEFEMHLSLYAAPHVAAPDLHDIKPEEDLTGYLWLQGYLATETEQ